MSVVLRYVDISNNFAEIDEDFIKFIPVERRTGENLKTEILLFLREFNLKLENLRAQGYGSGANMRGKSKGVQNLISKENNRAFYMPCNNHVQNLCLNDFANPSVILV